MFNSSRRFAPLVSLAGAGVLLVGLGLEVVRRLLNPGGSLSLFDPAYFIAAIGVALGVVGVVLWLLGRVGRGVVSSPGRTALVGAAGVVSLLAVAGFVFSASVLARGDVRAETGDAGGVHQASADGHAMGHDHGGGQSAPVTAAEQKAADKLISDTKAGADRFKDIDVARAEGYEPLKGIGGEQPGSTQAVHLVNKGYVEDGKLLDSEHPESLVYAKTRDGGMDLIGVMYVAPRGEGPTVGGGLTQWHTHDDLCISPDGTASSQTGGCPEDSWSVSDFEMMHVWLFDHPDGPFSPDMAPADILAAEDAKL